jgi:PhnB protein
MKIEPYLWGFSGRCEEAVEFYKQALGAEVQMLMRFKDSPEPCGDGPAPDGEKIMHGSLKIGDSILMVSDGQCAGDKGPQFEGMSLSLNPAAEADARKIFDALSDGGQISMPLGKTFWSPCFGMVTDRFGVAWMINVVP